MKHKFHYLLLVALVFTIFAPFVTDWWLYSIGVIVGVITILLSWGNKK